MLEVSNDIWHSSVASLTFIVSIVSVYIDENSHIKKL